MKVKNVTKMTAIAAAALAMFSGIASADPAETKGGITIKTEDGRFEAKVGGRIHFDGNLISEDDPTGVAGTTFGSMTTPAQSGFYMRRIYMTLSGKLYGWKYKIEPDFAPNNGTGATGIAFQDITLSTDLGPGELILGQRKPFRSMEDLTSSNDILMIERPFASASGGMLKGGTNTNAAIPAAAATGGSITAAVDREFQQGLFYKGNGDNYTWGVSFHSLRRDNTAATEGIGESARVTYTPMSADGSILHLGLSYSAENPQNNQSGATSDRVCMGAGSFNYAGRRGPSFNLGCTTGDLSTIGAEVAGAFGPFFFQAEYMTQDQKDLPVVGGGSQTIDAYYLQSSFFVTGESKPYKKADGVFGSAKPNNAAGALEITARYDFAENKDITATSVGTLGAGLTNPGSCATAAGSVSKCEISAITVGANYYFNPNVRVMLNYVMGEADRGVGGTDKPKAVAARAQISF